MMNAPKVYTPLLKKWDAKTDPRMAHVLCETYKTIPKSKFIYLVGVPDDRGVKNNQGREGAAKGPDTFRKYFGKLTTFEGAEKMCDLGNIPIKNTLQATHSELANLVKDIHNKNPDALVIVIGGGHDYAYGEISGLIEARPEKKIGICNIDAHLDLRPVLNNVISSGTPFWRLWEDYEDHIGYHLTFGAQKSAVAKSHLKYAEARRTKVVFSHEVFSRVKQEEVLRKEMDLLFSADDRVSINIDLDAFNMAHAPGVSAPAAFGLHPMVVTRVLLSYVANPFLKTLGIYELNPQVDYPGDPTSRLVAEMVYMFSGVRVKAMAKVAAKPKRHVI